MKCLAIICVYALLISSIDSKSKHSKKVEQGDIDIFDTEEAKQNNVMKDQLILSQQDLQNKKGKKTLNPENIENQRRRSQNKKKQTSIQMDYQDNYDLLQDPSQIGFLQLNTDFGNFNTQTSFLQQGQTFEQPTEQQQRQQQPSINENSLRSNDNIQRYGKFGLQELQEEADQDDNRMKCDGISRESAKEVCQSCEADYTYLLDDDNWYLIGLAHGFKKEFQTLLDSTKEKIGNGTIFLSFSSDNDICLASDDLQGLINVDEVLKMFHSDSLDKYQIKNPLFTIPKEVNAHFFKVRATYDGPTKRYSYDDFHLIVNGENEKFVKQGGSIKKLLLEFKDDLVFNITYQNIKVSIIYNGEIKVQQKNLPFLFENYVGTQNAEKINFNLALKEHSQVLQGFSTSYLSQTLQDELKDFISSDDFSKVRDAKLQLSTIEDEDELNISFILDRI